MNFTGHAGWGALASGAMLVGLTSLSLLDPGWTSPRGWLLLPWPAAVSEAAGLFCTCFFFSLFPDLDIRSTPQQWFYRFYLLFLLLLWTQGQSRFFALAALVGYLPLVGQHRGWTHRWWAPFGLALVLLLLDAWLQRSAWQILQGDLEAWLRLAGENWRYLLAAGVGQMTHLVADGGGKTK